MLTIPTLGRLRQEDHELEASLAYPISKQQPPQKRKEKKKN
jgi:hypothetical protein